MRVCVIFSSSKRDGKDEVEPRGATGGDGINGVGQWKNHTETVRARVCVRAGARENKKTFSRPPTLLETRSGRFSIEIIIIVAINYYYYPVLWLSSEKYVRRGSTAVTIWRTNKRPFSSRTDGGAQTNPSHHTTTPLRPKLRSNLWGAYRCRPSPPTVMWFRPQRARTRVLVVCLSARLPRFTIYPHHSHSGPLSLPVVRQFPKK